MGNTIYASFVDPALAEKAAGALLDHGVQSVDISVVTSHSGEGYVAPDGYHVDDINRPTITNHMAEDDIVVDGNDPDGVERSAKTGISTTTAADAGAGAAKGAGWGLGAGALAALAAMFIPGVGLVVGGGTLALALAGVAATTGAGAAAGAVTGYLKDQGVDEHVATHYEGVVAGGGSILSVNLPSGECSQEEAMMVLEKYGATNVNSYALSAQSPGYVA